MKIWNRLIHRSVTLGVLIASTLVAGGATAQEKFKNSEIRVIKNKYFQKRMRPEFSFDLSAIMNKTFTNTALAGGRLDFHITESWALFGEGHYGVTFKSSDCKTLGSKFQIEPLVDNLNWWAGGGLAYTPVYGKFQIPTGQVIYFDWYFTLGGGTAQVEHREKNTCYSNAQDSETDITQANKTYSRILFTYGTGQRYFLNDNVSLNWQFRLLNIQPSSDTATAVDAFTAQPSVVLSMGVSYFL